MKINWVYAEGYAFDPTADLETIKNIGPSWGSWKTWRGCSTDNVVCHNISKTKELLQRAFQSVCNLHVPKSQYQNLGRPLGVKLYDGNFQQELDQTEDVIALHLASTQSDIVLLLGFDLSTQTLPDDDFEKHKIRNYYGLIRSAIRNSPETQFVLVDHSKDLDKAFKEIPNLTCDIMANVLKLLS
jgi:hypothetical protein